MEVKPGGVRPVDSGWGFYIMVNGYKVAFPHHEKTANQAKKLMRKVVTLLKDLNEKN